MSFLRFNTGSTFCVMLCNSWSNNVCYGLFVHPERFHLRGQAPVLIDCAHLFLLFWLSRTLPRQDDFVFCLVLLLQIAISLSIFCPNLRLFLSDAILNLAQQIKFYPAPALPGQKHCKLLKSICSVTPSLNLQRYIFN